MGSKGTLSIMIAYMLYSIKINIPFNFAYFMANRMLGSRTNGRLLLYARLFTTLFEYAENKLPNQGRFPQCKAVDPIFTDFNSDHLHRTDIEYAKPKHGASSSRGPQLDPRERIEAQVDSWFDEDVWINAEDRISTDEEVDEPTLRNMSFGDRIAYKSYVTGNGYLRFLSSHLTSACPQVEPVRIFHKKISRV
ncbi:hypothetical protein Tco_1082476 [Tanacetum coccineum]|uniref:Transposase n=1 Tax=Tanacetum coccineum TaxID=301880 RepID=A0ABQ5I0G6_9ASTR